MTGTGPACHADQGTSQKARPQLTHQCIVCTRELGIAAVLLPAGDVSFSRPERDHPQSSVSFVTTCIFDFGARCSCCCVLRHVLRCRVLSDGVGLGARAPRCSLLVQDEDQEDGHIHKREAYDRDSLHFILHSLCSPTTVHVKPSDTRSRTNTTRPARIMVHAMSRGARRRRRARVNGALATAVAPPCTEW